MYKTVTPLRWIKLNDPVNIWYVYPSAAQIRSQQQPMLGLSHLLILEAAIDLAPLFLVDLSVQLEYLHLLGVKDKTECQVVVVY